MFVRKLRQNGTAMHLAFANLHHFGSAQAPAFVDFNKTTTRTLQVHVTSSTWIHAKDSN